MNPDVYFQLKNEVIKLAVDGYLIDGEHHKQWYFEQIMKLCGCTDREIKAFDGERGVTP